MDADCTLIKIEKTRVHTDLVFDTDFCDSRNNANDPLSKEMLEVKQNYNTPMNFLFIRYSVTKRILSLNLAWI